MSLESCLFDSLNTMAVWIAEAAKLSKRSWLHRLEKSPLAHFGLDMLSRKSFVGIRAKSGRSRSKFGKCSCREHYGFLVQPPDVISGIELAQQGL